eukprot:TRINITY_DN448_c0_g2_i1.p2 TRINITY_DN448_c0_g2~~TRINITY_DN448_c0_g2_i1.p2  ORF type:complete len:190 (-),score=59.93 TRINITY_DN448_c0_g2_i1:127-696(-)
MSIASTIVRSLIKYHPLVLLPWILVQFAIGSLLHHGAVKFAGFELFQYTLSSDLKATLFSGHKFSGTLLAVEAFLLLVSKIYILNFKVARPKISSPIVATIVKNHFLGFGPLVIFQYVGQEYADLIAGLVGVPVSTIWWAHGIVAQIVVVYALFLSAVGTYKQTLTPAASTRPRSPAATRILREKSKDS